MKYFLEPIGVFYVTFRNSPSKAQNDNIRFYPEVRRRVRKNRHSFSILSIKWLKFGRSVQTGSLQNLMDLLQVPLRLVYRL